MYPSVSSSCSLRCAVRTTLSSSTTGLLIGSAQVAPNTSIVTERFQGGQDIVSLALEETDPLKTSLCHQQRFHGHRATEISTFSLLRRLRRVVRFPGFPFRHHRSRSLMSSSVAMRPAVGHLLEDPGRGCRIVGILDWAVAGMHPATELGGGRFFFFQAGGSVDGPKAESTSVGDGESRSPSGVDSMSSSSCSTLGRFAEPGASPSTDFRILVSGFA